MSGNVQPPAESNLVATTARAIALLSNNFKLIMAPFKPGRADVYSVRALLASRKLPNELITTVLEHAHYWVERYHYCTELKVLMDEEFSTEYSAAVPYLAMAAFPRRPRLDSEAAKIREIEFLVVSHDQGWTTENTEGTYQTSSWFEVSILRPSQHEEFSIITPTIESQVKRLCRSSKYHHSVCAAAHAMFPVNGLQLQPRPSLKMEPQRLHCNEMINVAESREELSKDLQFQSTKEGEFAWYLQGNEVARGKSIFDDEMVRRYNIVWGGKFNPRWVGNEGSGRGEGFVDSLQEGDWVVVWARAKRRGWENIVHGIRVTVRSTI